MENDLISRAAAIAQIKENYCDWCDHTDLCKSCETHDCIASIEQHVPAVDAVPVVRCKDCHYWHQELDEVHHWYCTYGWAHQTTPDHYCADGKRRDGE